MIHFTQDKDKHFNCPFETFISQRNILRFCTHILFPTLKKKIYLTN